MGKKIAEVTEDNFKEFVSKGDAVIDFYADWCGPCKIMKPEFDKASESMTSVNFGKVDVDQNMELAGKYRVMSIPTTIFFKKGEQVDRHSGVLTAEDIAKKAKQVF